MRVAITYAVVAWGIMQVAGLTFENFGVPVWAFRFVTIMLVIFFPVAIILVWAFELTPDGIKTTQHAREDRGDAPVSKKQQRQRAWFSILFAAGLPTVIFAALAFFFCCASTRGKQMPPMLLPVLLVLHKPIRSWHGLTPRQTMIACKASASTPSRSRG